MKIMFLTNYKNQLWAIVLTFIVSTLVFATPPTTPYIANETLDPACAPGDTNCIVQLANTSDNLGNHTATGNILMNDNWLSGDGDSEGVFVDTAWNVGIGTNNPLQKLHTLWQIIWDRTLNQFAAMNGSWQYLASFSAQDILGVPRLGLGVSSTIWWALSIRMAIIWDTGNVWIWTGSPWSLLHISKNDATAYDSSSTWAQLTLFLQNPLNGNNLLWGQIVFWQRTPTYYARIWATGGSSPNLFFTTNNVERMRIDQNGNVWIGINIPTAKLQINNEDSTFDLKPLYIINKDPEQLSLFELRNENINWNGNFSITRWPDFWSADLALRLNASGNNSLSFWVHGWYDNMVIRKSWNVGIGTSTPGEKLEVNGYGKFTSSIKIPGAGASSTGYYACIDGTTGEIYKWGGACSLSDIRLKKDIINLDPSNSLEKVLWLQGVSFKWKEWFRGDAMNIWFIAQDVEKIFPEAVTENPDGMKAMNYEFIIAPLVESIKELYNRLTSNDKDIETLKKVIELQQKQIKSQQSQIDELKSKIN